MFKPVLNLVKNEVDKTARINLYGVIGWSWGKAEDEQITAENFVKLFASLEKDYHTIDVHIHSPGGSVHEGLAICNAILASKRTVNTYNDGIAMSMGAVILACGSNRYAAKGSITMLHSASTIAWGNAKALRSEADVLDVYDDTLIEFFVSATNKSYDEIKSEYFDHQDHYLTAKQASDIGLVTLIDAEAKEVPEDVNQMQFNRVAALYKGYPQNTQINNHDMFGKDKFKSLTAMAKLAVNDITAEMVEAVNNEIVAQEIDGVTVVLDSELQKVNDEANKVPGLNTKVTDLEGKLTAEQTKVTDLEKQVKELKAKLGQPAEEPETPTPASSDATPADGQAVEDSFETSYDREAIAAFGGKQTK